MNTIFGEEHFIDTAMVELVEQRNRAIDNLVFEQMENVLKCEASVPMPNVVIDKDKLRKWVVLCMKLENVEESELVDIATRKKFLDLKQQIADLEAKLAEKNKQIETQKKNLAFFYDVFNNPKGKQTLETINQDKISFCIEQLEKVKNKFNAKRPIDDLANEVGVNLGYTAVQIQNYIDNQIKQLKEMK